MGLTMSFYNVDVKAFLKVSVEADSPEAAEEAAKALVEACAPSALFISGFNTVRPGKAQIVPGDLAFDTADPAVIEDEDGNEVEGFESY